MSMELLRTIRNRYLLFSDVVLLSVFPFVAYGLRFEGWSWPHDEARTAILYAVLSMLLKLVIFAAAGLYRRLWRHSSVADMAVIIKSAVVAAAGCSLLGIVLLPALGVTSVPVPISVAILDSFFTGTALALPRLMLKAMGNGHRGRHSGGVKRVLIAGAGSAGEMILKEMLSNPQLGFLPVGFVDDDASKHNLRLGNKPIFGSLTTIPEIIKRERIGEIVIAMPRVAGSVVRKIVKDALDAGVGTRTVPGLFEILSGRVGVSNLRKVEIQDLLRRAPIHTDLAAVSSLVTGRTVLVTGAGGSIGSELCRQLARLAPERLILFDHAENPIFDVLQELKEENLSQALIPVIGDVRDAARVRSLFQEYRPYAVFHAAAHKHVPLMEENVAEAVTNNILGTRNVVASAAEVGAAHCVFISTDKAVRPSSVMGATKRIAEMVMQDIASRHTGNFVSVRFGNVLGSRGSVVPTFLRQIQAGGPVTITHPDMRRYFMTIPEAVQLVLQAAALGQGADLFMLDMAEPVRILDLATDLIRLSGLQVDRDIEIRFTGVRPGERLCEEMLHRAESVSPTAHSKILRVRNVEPVADVMQFLDSLIVAAQVGQPDKSLRILLKSLVPAFAVAGDHGQPATPSVNGGWRNHMGPVQRAHADRRAARTRREAGRSPQIRGRVAGNYQPRMDRRMATNRRCGVDRRSEADKALSDVAIGNPAPTGIFPLDIMVATANEDPAAAVASL
jgi:FlaA1/EpsC-like NDP-sugar epimerase